MHNNYIHSEKKTVLLITPFIIYPLNNGGKLRIHNFYKRLSEKYNLILLSLIHDEKEREYAYPIKDIFKEIHLIHTKTPANEFLFPKRYKYSFSSFLIDKLKEIQEERPIDVIHIESNELLYLIKYIKCIPIVYTEHDISILSYRKSYYKKEMSDSLLDFIDYLKVVYNHHFAYGKIDKVIALSKEDTKFIKAFSPQSDCSLIHTGVDLEHFTFLDKAGRNKSLIFVGHYQHYPNEEAVSCFCRHIFPIVKKAMPQVTLKLVGSDPTDNVIKLSEIDGVEVISNVPDVNPYLQEASVFVNALHSSAGIKGKVLEAMATGTPVVSTTVGACGIEAINGQSILIADKPVDFANYVIELLKNDVLYRKIASNGRTLVEQKYDWDIIAKQLDRVYQELTGAEGLASEMPAVSIATRENITLENIVDNVDKIINQSLSYLNKDKKSTIPHSPEELHIELTHKCNSRCITCDIWDFQRRNNKSVNDELSLTEIRNLIIKSEWLKSIKTIVLSGGEPFLRPDLIEICSTITNTLPSVSIGILTNGLNTEAILSKTKAIIKTCKMNSLWVGSSLDGIGHMYDKIRGTQQGFKHFAKTVERFKRELPEIPLSATFVLTPFNMAQLIPCWEFAEQNGLDFFAQFGVPKQARSAEVFQWSQQDFIKIKEYIREIIKRMISKVSDLESFNSSLTKVSDKINLLTKIYYWTHLVDFQQTGNRIFYNCDAGFKFAMFDPYGNMFFCPLLKDKVIGNVRNKSLDELWTSEEANRIRDFINSGKCSCWLVCMVFPLVGEALYLYGDEAALSLHSEHSLDKSGIQLRSEIREAITLHIDKVDTFLDRKDLLSSVTANIRSNTELNNEEFRQKKCILESMPQRITIGTNYGCNANCIFCLEGEYKPFSFGLYKDYFEPRIGFMLGEADYVSFCGMGELLLVPDIEKILDYLNERISDKNKILTTNGLALNSRIVERITSSKYSLQISLHASNPSLHQYLTGIKNGGFERIIQQVRTLTAKRKSRQSPYITFIFVVNTMNIEDLPNFVELAASLGVDCVQCNYLTIFKQSHLKLSCFFKQKITNEMFDIAAQKADDLKIPLVLPPRFSENEYFKNICSDPWKNIYVDTEGAVLPCCYSGEHFGELKDNDILSIWNNDKFRRIRTALSSGTPIEMCKYCLNSNPANVKLLNSHVSFRPEVQKLVLN